MINRFTERQKIFFSLSLAICSFMFFSSCSFLRVVVLKDPLTPEEHLNLGVAYETKGELDQAIKEYKLAAKKLPLAYLYLGNAYFLKNELEEAESYYRKAIRKDPKNADAYNNLAWLNFTVPLSQK